MIIVVVPVATALTVYGIETLLVGEELHLFQLVATALTVYGIETVLQPLYFSSKILLLQQPLPFTVLKLHIFVRMSI